MTLLSVFSTVIAIPVSPSYHPGAARAHYFVFVDNVPIAIFCNLISTISALFPDTPNICSDPLGQSHNDRVNPDDLRYRFDPGCAILFGLEHLSPFLLSVSLLIRLFLSVPRDKLNHQVLSSYWQSEVDGQVASILIVYFLRLHLFPVLHVIFHLCQVHALLVVDVH